ncbi:MAG: solute carrier family 26 protein [Lewinellaceae bacterium]|nr:solute carrier family 26 protein [Lewinellaceae bacterium]
MNIRRFVPALEWLPQYTKTQLKGDLSAGLTVGVMLIPQGMAYSMLAGLPPIYGLYAVTLPLIVYALLGTSRQLAVGPVAMVSLLTASGIGALAAAGSDAYLQLAILLALIVGAIQLLLGVFRLGFLVNFLSHPVISGFTSAAALIIGISQLKHLLGIKLVAKDKVHEVLMEATQRISETNAATFLLGIVGIALIMGVKKWSKTIPGPLVAVIFGILAVYLFGLDSQGVKIVGEVPSGLPQWMTPAFSLDAFQTLLPVALTISLVGFMESIAVAKAIQSKHKNYKLDANQELVALGAANLAGGFFQSFPVTGGFSRTAVNDQAGAQTGMASLISAGLIILTLLFLTPLFYFLPQAILASVIMVAVFGLIDIKEVKHLWHSDRTDLAMLLVTFAATLSLGIEEGIGIGVILSLAMVIFRSTRPHIAILGRVPGTRTYRNLERFPELEDRPDILIMRFDADLYFANLNFFQDTLDEQIKRKGKALRGIVFNMESVNNIDSSAIHTLLDVVADCRKNKLECHFSTVKGPIRDAMAKAHLTETIGEDHFFLNIQDAVDAFDELPADPTEETTPFQEYTLQTNV